MKASEFVKHVEKTGLTWEKQEGGFLGIQVLGPHMSQFFHLETDIAEMDEEVASFRLFCLKRDNDLRPQREKEKTERLADFEALPDKG